MRRRFWGWVAGRLLYLSIDVRTWWLWAEARADPEKARQLRAIERAASRWRALRFDELGL